MHFLKIEMIDNKANHIFLNLKLAFYSKVNHRSIRKSRCAYIVGPMISNKLSLFVGEQSTHDMYTGKGLLTGASVKVP